MDDQTAAYVRWFLHGQSRVLNNASHACTQSFREYVPNPFRLQEMDMTHTGL